MKNTTFFFNAGAPRVGIPIGVECGLCVGVPVRVGVGLGVGVLVGVVVMLLHGRDWCCFASVGENFCDGAQSLSFTVR